MDIACEAKSADIMCHHTPMCSKAEEFLPVSFRRRTPDVEHTLAITSQPSFEELKFISQKLAG